MDTNFLPSKIIINFIYYYCIKHVCYIHSIILKISQRNDITAQQLKTREIKSFLLSRAHIFFPTSEFFRLTHNLEAIQGDPVTWLTRRGMFFICGNTIDWHTRNSFHLGNETGGKTTWTPATRYFQSPCALSKNR